MIAAIVKLAPLSLARMALCLILLAGMAAPCFAQVSSEQNQATNTTLPDGSMTADTNSATSTNAPVSLEAALPEGLQGGPEKWASPEGLSSTLQVMLLLTVLSLAPAVLIMTTSFVRIVVVLGLLRQAIGTQQLPPSQVITSLALFISLLIMTPTWKKVYNDAIVPYTNHEINLDEAWERGVAPVRQFMAMQIERTGNSDDVHLFLEYIPNESSTTPTTYEEVPITVLLPAYVLSELKTAFLIGFQIFLPFLILDMVVASVMVSMGMLMLPPVLISLPFKLLLFVLLDGWTLVVGMLLDSFSFVT
ncbi:MAG: flagellar type III secretion system pore protein FliP [Planctomycetia bacterium]|jgi:flagellar biosynthetic protein FliP